MCVCGGGVTEVDGGYEGISSIGQVTLPSEPLLLAWECSKKSAAKGPAPFVCPGLWSAGPQILHGAPDRHVELQYYYDFNCTTLERQISYFSLHNISIKVLEVESR